MSETARWGRSVDVRDCEMGTEHPNMKNARWGPRWGRSIEIEIEMGTERRCHETARWGRSVDVRWGRSVQKERTESAQKTAC